MLSMLGAFRRDMRANFKVVLLLKSTYLCLERQRINVIDATVGLGLCYSRYNPAPRNVLFTTARRWTLDPSITAAYSCSVTSEAPALVGQTKLQKAMRNVGARRRCRCPRQKKGRLASPISECLTPPPSQKPLTQPGATNAIHNRHARCQVHPKRRLKPKYTLNLLVGLS